MNIKDYISSGVIENYVLGFTSPEETKEVEYMAGTHSEVKDAINAYQETMEAYSELHAIKPPAALKTRIMDAMLLQGNPDSKITPSNRKESSTRLTLLKWKWVAAAAVILLLASVVLNSIYIGKYRQYRDLYTGMLEGQQQLAAQNKVIETKLAKVEKNMNVLMNPSMKPVVMVGMKKHPGMTATIYWDPQSRHTYLGTTNLPDPPGGMAYQLWAIVDGKPVDMGMYNPANEKGPLAMKNVVSGTVQAFAITLEKQNGSPTPTMDQMYVMGKI